MGALVAGLENPQARANTTIYEADIEDEENL
jgi:hypothetical protein